MSAILWGFPRTARRFDLRAASAAYGARLFCRIVPKARWRVMTLELKGVSYPISLRPGTSDWRVLHRVFVDEQYDSASQAHETALSQFYEDVLGQSETPVHH